MFKYEKCGSLFINSFALLCLHVLCTMFDYVVFVFISGLTAMDHTMHTTRKVGTTLALSKLSGKCLLNNNCGISTADVYSLFI